MLLERFGAMFLVKGGYGHNNTLWGSGCGSHIIISFDTFGAATLPIIAVCGPVNGSQRCMGADAQKTSLESTVPRVQ